MSLLGDLFGYWLKTQVAKEFAVYKKLIDEMIAREDGVLRSLGIEPPRLVSEFSYSQEMGEKNNLIVELIAPQFELPPYLMFVITEKPVMNESGLIATIFDNVEEVATRYWWWGLGDVVSKEWAWTNRDPFALYRALQVKPNNRIYHSRSGDFKSNVQIKNNQHNGYSLEYKAKLLQQLKKVRGLTNTEASNIHLRVQLYNQVTGGGYHDLRDRKTYYALGSNGARRIPHDILFRLPIACTSILYAYSCIKILPAGAIKAAQMVEFLNSLHNTNRFISFELLREGETVCFRLQFPTESESEIISKLNLYFPDFEYLYTDRFNPQTTVTTNWLQKTSAYDSIRRLRDFQLDPYSHFAAFFDGAKAGELLCYQIIFAPLLDEAAATLKRHIASGYNDKYSEILAKRLPLWLVCVSTSAANEQTAHPLTETVARTFDTPNGNFSKPRSHPLTNYDFPMLFPGFLTLFDTEELAALAHFPITELPIERLEKTSMKNVKPPESYSGEAAAVRVGETRARGQVFPVTIPETVRDRHVYIVGKSGTGKSTIMETIARRDIQAGRGLAVIDPHGDLVNHLLETIPPERVADCILFSPKHFPISLEILSAENDHEIDLLSDDLITMFRRTSESWGDKMQAILQMAFQTLLRVPGSSFTDITRLLTDDNFRNSLLAKINHPQLESFWNGRYEMRQAEPILIRMDRLTTSGTLRAVLTQNKNSLNFYDVITESKIFLADLSKGFLGESTSHLLGSIIVSQIQLAAMRQAHLPVEQRIPFSLFVDEVQNFTTSAFSTILSEARKQKLRLTIAHQFVSQLPSDLQKAVFGNVGTLFFFALSPDDLGAARHELGTFEPSDVANLPKYHALCRPVTAARDTFLFATDPPPPPPAKNYAREIIERTRRQYSSDYEPQPEIIAESQAQTSRVPAIGFIQPKRTEATPQIQLRPADAMPPVFTTNTEKILHYLRQSEYLTQPQIIALTELLPPNASTALKKLCETAQIKSLDDRRPKIYFIGRTCNATAHNLLVRDLFVKICASRFAARSIKFNENLSDLNPDLSVEFVARQDNTLTPLPAYFELDRGTEGVQELVKKADRYARLPDNPRVGFIFERESDLLLARKTIQYPFITYAVLDQFTSLKDNAFYASANASADDIQLPFFR
jgi:hypothetical protein